MKITQEVREFADKEGVAEDGAIEAGLKTRAEEFRKQGAELYH
ncbi:hypothetical protein ACFL59_15350 [Planctomycetota bacterium]